MMVPAVAKQHFYGMVLIWLLIGPLALAMPPRQSENLRNWGRPQPEARIVRDGVARRPL